jgi:hypothetical protein
MSSSPFPAPDPSATRDAGGIPPAPVSSRAAAGRSTAPGTAALVLAIIAVVAGVVVGGLIGAGVSYWEDQYGYYFSDIPENLQGLLVIGVVTMFLWTALGITGLVLGIVAAARDRGRVRGVIAIVLAVVGPVLASVAGMAGLSIGAV